jgi:hypothetical protein
LHQITIKTPRNENQTNKNQKKIKKTISPNPDTIMSLAMKGLQNFVEKFNQLLSEMVTSYRILSSMKFLFRSYTKILI